MPDYLVITRQQSSNGSNGEILPRLMTYDAQRAIIEAHYVERLKNSREHTITIFKLNKEMTYSLDYYNTPDGVKEMIAYQSIKRDDGTWVTLIDKLNS